MIFRQVGIERVPKDHKVLLPFDVDDRMVEAEDNVSSVSSEGDHHVIRTGDILLYLFQYGFFRIAFLVFGHRIDDPTRCGTKVVYLG